MEKVRKGYEILDEKISPDNVMRMGELLALSALKFMCGHKMLHRMYANLARDIDYKDLDGYVLTDSYDLAQEAALFLCGYMGKSVFDTCIDPKSGKTYAIRRMCSKILCHKLYEEWKIKRYTDSTEDLYRSKEPFADFEQKRETDYTKYDGIMEKFNLNKGEKETLECYIVGIGFTEQALKAELQILINQLVKEIVLYNNKIEIYYNNPTTKSPDESQGFLLYVGKRKIVSEIQNKSPKIVIVAIEM